MKLKQINSSGLTWLEIIVVLSCVFIMLGLLLPAIQATKHGAHQFDCSNNLKHIGLAIHNYHSVHRQLPPAMFGTEVNGRRLSGLVALLPFLEEQTKWEAISNPNRFDGNDFPAWGPVPTNEDYPPWSEPVSVFRCYWDEASAETLARTNYVFCVGDQTQRLYDADSLESVRGMFSPSQVTSFDDVIDGLTNTVAMTEVATAQHRVSMGQYVVKSAAQTSTSPEACWLTVGGRVDGKLSPKERGKPRLYLDAYQLSRLGRGGAWADGSGGSGLANLILPPNSPSCASNEIPPWEGVFSAGSRHQGGCHVLMGDGAVKFIAEFIESGNGQATPPIRMRDDTDVLVRSPYGLWGALGTRASEEQLREDL